MIETSDSVDRGLDLVEESELKMSYEVEKCKEMSKKLMALRLTCKRLKDIANRNQFRRFCLLPYLESPFEVGCPWTKLRRVY